jgi:hypothetical protein
MYGWRTLFGWREGEVVIHKEFLLSSFAPFIQSRITRKCIKRCQLLKTLS